MTTVDYSEKEHEIAAIVAKVLNQINGIPDNAMSWKELTDQTIVASQKLLHNIICDDYGSLEQFHLDLAANEARYTDHIQSYQKRAELADEYRSVMPVQDTKPLPVIQDENIAPVETKKSNSIADKIGKRKTKYDRNKHLEDLEPDEFQRLFWYRNS